MSASPAFVRLAIDPARWLFEAEAEGVCMSTAARNVVLVHGGFVDGSGWAPTYRLLRARGFSVSIVQNPTLSLSDDVRVT